jgi:hypothetical protein
MSRYFLACILVTSLVVVFLATYFSKAITPNRFVVLEGEFESLKIGATKSALLEVLKDQKASLIPLSGVESEAHHVIDTIRLTDEDIEVLDAAPSWRSDDIGTSACPDDRSGVSTLRFDGNKLLRIEIVCVLTGDARDG